jgi:Mg/Co/Ni transporter MgtE
MSTPQIKEYNCETQEEITRDATDAEIAQMAKDKSDAEAAKAEAKTKAAKRAELLSKLGITEEEARILLG